MSNSAKSWLRLYSDKLNLRPKFPVATKLLPTLLTSVAWAKRKPMPCDPHEIAGVLKDAGSGLQDKIVHNLGNYTVALLGISDHPERLELAGTGTLMAIDGAHYILTARHVWDEVLAPADHVGITLKPDVNHRYSNPSRDFTPVGLPKPGEWNEWGPDLILLRIPGECVGTIGAYRSFWNPVRRVDIHAEGIEVMVLMGTPAELGTIADSHADLQITGMYLGPEKLQHMGGFDYLDYEIELKVGLPRHFGGVSGGGVWRVWVFCSPETGEIDWKMSFHGVAFYQLDIGKNPTIIRCHGPESARAVLHALTPQPKE